MGLQLLCSVYCASKDMIGRMFFHGPGGSGKTYVLTQVVLPVYEAYLPRASRGAASQNSAARLIGGSTFHYMAALTRGRQQELRPPSKKRLLALSRRWARLALFFMGEISLASPPLLAELNAAACWGRSEITGNHDVGSFTDATLGGVLCQIIAGDFLQLNPVRNHSLMEAPWLWLFHTYPASSAGIFLWC